MFNIIVCCIGLFFIFPKEYLAYVCINTRCYTVHDVSVKKTQIDCAAGSNLIEIHNAQIQADLESFLIDGEYHIGLSDTASEGTYKWESGSSLTYENFSPSHKNNGGQNCVRISSADNWKWRNANCNKKAGYICTYQGTSYQETTVITTTTTTTTPVTTTTLETTTNPVTTTTLETTTTPVTTTTLETTTNPVTTPSLETTTTPVTTTLETTTTPVTTTLETTTTPVTTTTTTTLETTTTPVTTTLETTTTPVTTTLETTTTPVTTTSVWTRVTQIIQIWCPDLHRTFYYNNSETVTPSAQLQSLLDELDDQGDAIQEAKKKRRNTSANDERVSSQTIGLIGVAMLGSIGLFILIMDLSSIKRDLITLRGNLCPTDSHIIEV